MSKGNAQRKFRLSDDEYAVVMAAIDSRNSRTAGEPWTDSDFYRKCIVEKLAHLKRGRARRGCVTPPARRCEIAREANGGQCVADGYIRTEE